jgi:hypothetical protein
MLLAWFHTCVFRSIYILLSEFEDFFSFSFLKVTDTSANTTDIQQACTTIIIGYKARTSPALLHLLV